MVHPDDRPVEVRVDDSPDPEDVRALVASLVSFNATQVEREEWQPLAAFARREGQLIGGVNGHTHWTWLFVGHLWVAQEGRGSGLGRRLMSAMEDRARDRGCRTAWLDTYSFQALDFYEHLGYRRFGQLDDFPPGHVRYFLRKTLYGSGDD